MAEFARVRTKFPDLAEQLEPMQQRELPDGWDKDLPVFPADAKGMATRDSSQQGAQRDREERPLADRRVGRSGPVHQDPLTFEGAGDFEADSYGGRNFHFGIREHAMGAILNGMALSRCGPTARGS